MQLLWLRIIVHCMSLVCASWPFSADSVWAGLYTSHHDIPVIFCSACDLAMMPVPCLQGEGSAMSLHHACRTC